MKKKTIALCGLAALATLSLASCKDDEGKDDVGAIIKNGHVYDVAPADVVYDTELADNELDVYINYNGESGITWRDTTSFNNPVDGQKYDKGTLLPTWVEFAKKTKTVIREASEYTKINNNDIWTNVTANSFMSEVNKSEAIDLLYTTTANLNSGEFLNLFAKDASGKQYIEQMPYFKKWCDENPNILAQLTKDKGESLYYTPYAEGFDNVERMLVMDTNLVKLVLDVANYDAFDTGKTNGGTTPSENVVQSGTYAPYIHATKNYPDAETKVDVLVGNDVKEIAIKQTDNIIVQQNELLNRTQGCTGKELAEQFMNYLKAAFGHEVGEGKTYANYSEIFISKAAAYNTDELIALMRVIKANPGVITGDANAEVEGLFPRGEQANRITSLIAFMGVWGVQGVQNNINQRLYFDANGQLHDAYTTQATYDCLNNLGAMYKEGLILGDFNYKPSSGAAQTRYLDRYFKKTDENAGYGLLMWDFAAATTAANDLVNGVGTPSNKRTIQYETTGIMPILPPLAYWATEKTGWDHTQALNNHSGKTLVRYQESNLGLKTTSWGIPKSSDNYPAALRLMDYMYSEIGNIINCFGPAAYWQKPTADDTVVEGVDPNTEGLVSIDLLGGVKTPIISTSSKILLAQQSDFWTYMRNYVGATHGVGHFRHSGVDLQACNEHGQKGLSNVKAAYGKGVVVQSMNTKDGTYTWHTTTPKLGSYTDTNQDFQAITDFWADGSSYGNTENGWVKVVKNYGVDYSTSTVVNVSGTDFTYSEVIGQFTVRNQTFLYSYAGALGDAFIPSYAKK